jgi:hypothetical protein
MPELNAIRVIHTTADESTAETDADFQLQIFRTGEDILLDFPELPHDERERGRTDRYRFDVSGMGVDSSDPSFGLVMRMVTTTDGWLPASIEVLGETTTGQTVVLGSHDPWTDGAFDRQNPDASDTHLISN